MLLQKNDAAPVLGRSVQRIGMIPTYSEANHAYQMGSIFSQREGFGGPQTTSGHVRASVCLSEHREAEIGAPVHLAILSKPDVLLVRISCAGAGKKYF